MPDCDHCDYKIHAAAYHEAMMGFLKLLHCFVWVRLWLQNNKAPNFSGALPQEDKKPVA